MTDPYVCHDHGNIYHQYTPVMLACIYIYIPYRDLEGGSYEALEVYFSKKLEQRRMHKPFLLFFRDNHCPLWIIMADGNPVESQQ